MCDMIDPGREIVLFATTYRSAIKNHVGTDVNPVLCFRTIPTRTDKSLKLHHNGETTSKLF